MIYIYSFWRIGVVDLCLGDSRIYETVDGNTSGFNCCHTPMLFALNSLQSLWFGCLLII